jgi:hypothetical protein
MDKKDIERKYTSLLAPALAAPETLGGQIVAASLLEELIVAILKAGIVDTGRVENMLTRTSDRLNRMCEKLESPAPQDARLTANIERVKESGYAAIAIIRTRVMTTEETSEHPSTSG